MYSMGKQQSKYLKSHPCLSHAVNLFLSDCCSCDPPASCELSVLSLSFALFLLKSDEHRRILSRVLSEPNEYCLDTHVLLHDLNKWQEAAEELLLSPGALASSILSAQQRKVSSARTTAIPMARHYRQGMAG